MIEPGIYKAKTVSGMLGETSTGKEQVAISFLLEDGNTTAWYGYFSDKALPITLQALRTCGLVGADISDLSSIEGTEVQLTIEADLWEGVTRSKVRWINPLSGPVLKSPMDATKAKRFASEMRAHLLDFDKQSGAPKSKAEKAVMSPFKRVSFEPPAHDDSDSPPF